MYIRQLVFVGLVGSVAFLLNDSVLAQQDICRQTAGYQDFQIRVQYGNSIDFWLRLSAALRQKGVDPSNFPQANPDGSVDIINIPALVQRLAFQRDTALGTIYQAFQECESGFAPYQKIVDIGVFFATAGFSQIIPPAATHVDVSQIFSGTPFGGPGALIPQARSQILDTLGVGGDVRKVIENPRCIFGC